jgi:drug/metabolite transporter (DMT)-like permease
VLAAALALAASLSWGVGDFLAGVKSRSLHVLAVMGASMPFGLAAIALAVAVSGTARPPSGSLVYAALAGAAGACGLAALYRGMGIGAISVVAPLSATSPVIPIAVGLARGERPGVVQYVGIVCAIAGIVLASREAAGAGPRSARLAAGAGLGLLAALGFGAFFVALDAAASESALWATLTVRATSLTLVVLAVAVVRPRFPRRPAELGVLAAVGVLDTLANLLFAAAVTRGYISVVAVLASLYPAVTVGLAFLFLGERLGVAQRAGVVLALMGAALISAGG